MKTLLIFQRDLLHYRKDYYRELAKQLEGKFQLQLITAQNDIGSIAGVEIIELKAKRISKLQYLPGLLAYTRKADICICMFDIQWLNLYQELVLHRNKTLLWGHGFGRRRIARWPRIALMKYAKAIMLYERENVERISALGIDIDKLFYNGNTIQVSNSAMNWNAKQKNKLLYVGRLQARKGVDSLLRLFAKSRDQFDSKIELLIVGDGEERKALEDLAVQLGIAEQVEFAGACFDEEQLKTYFDQALLYVCPGLVGLGILHAFAYGVGAATFADEQHGPEVFNIEQGKNGFVFDDEAKMLALFVKASREPEYFRTLGAAAFDYYQQQRSIEKMAQRTIAAVEYCQLAQHS